MQITVGDTDVAAIAAAARELPNDALVRLIFGERAASAAWLIEQIQAARFGGRAEAGAPPGSCREAIEALLATGPMERSALLDRMRTSTEYTNGSIVNCVARMVTDGLLLVSVKRVNGKDRRIYSVPPHGRRV